MYRIHYTVILNTVYYQEFLFKLHNLYNYVIYICIFLNILSTPPPLKNNNVYILHIQEVLSIFYTTSINKIGQHFLDKEYPSWKDILIFLRHKLYPGYIVSKFRSVWDKNESFCLDFFGYS